MDTITTKKQLKLARWSAIVQDAQSSPLKLKDWLIANNLTKDQFYYWKRKVEEACITQTLSSLVEIPIEDIKQLPSIDNKNLPSPDIKQKPHISATMTFGEISIDIYNNASKEFLSSLMEVILHA